MPPVDPASPVNEQPKKPEASPKNFKAALLRLVGDGKNLPGVILAGAALVTAITSMVKAVDTSVERASYEAVSKEIQDLKTNQNAMWETLKAVSSAKPPTVTFVTPPVSSALPVENTAKPVAVNTTRATRGVAPAAPTPAATASAIVAVVMSPPPPPAAPAPPKMSYDMPSFDDVQAAAAD